MHIVYEVYVPINDNGVFVGALEFYTDATTLHHLTKRRIEIAFVVVSSILTIADSTCQRNFCFLV